METHAQPIRLDATSLDARLDEYRLARLARLAYHERRLYWLRVGIACRIAIICGCLYLLWLLVPIYLAG